MQTRISKEKLTEIIDGLFLQIVWILLCIDSLEALRDIDKSKKKIAKNFLYITKTSLVYRYSMELAKLFDNRGLSLYEIIKRCKNNPDYFYEKFDVEQYCDEFRRTLSQHNTLISNIRNRRRKTYAHNDEEYYLFSQKAIDDFPLDFEEIKIMSEKILHFAKRLQVEIGSKRSHMDYPTYYDDVKRLFGEKTIEELYLEKNQSEMNIYSVK